MKITVRYVADTDRWWWTIKAKRFSVSAAQDTEEESWTVARAERAAIQARREARDEAHN